MPCRLSLLRQCPCLQACPRAVYCPRSRAVCCPEGAAHCPKFFLGKKHLGIKRLSLTQGSVLPLRGSTLP